MLWPDQETKFKMEHCAKFCGAELAAPSYPFGRDEDEIKVCHRGVFGRACKPGECLHVGSPLRTCSVCHWIHVMPINHNKLCMGLSDWREHELHSKRIREYMVQKVNARATHTVPLHYKDGNGQPSTEISRHLEIQSFEIGDDYPLQYMLEKLPQRT